MDDGDTETDSLKKWTVTLVILIRDEPHALWKFHYMQRKKGTNTQYPIEIFVIRFELGELPVDMT